MSVLRKPYLSKMFMYNSLNFNMIFYVRTQRKRPFRGNLSMKLQAYELFS